MLADTYKKNVLEACANNPLKDLMDYVERVKVVSTLNSPQMLESANRVIRILKDAVLASVDEKLFKEPAEKELFEAIKTVDEKLAYNDYLKSLEAINPAVEKFFADVLVMDKDENVKKNRQALLALLKQKYEVLAEGSKL